VLLSAVRTGWRKMLESGVVDMLNVENFFDLVGFAIIIQLLKTAQKAKTYKCKFNVVLLYCEAFSFLPLTIFPHCILVMSFYPNDILLVYTVYLFCT
jgi:hypothetical protein